jgi:hypothetical protein
MSGVTIVKPGVTRVLHSISRFDKSRVFLSLAFLNYCYCCSSVHALAYVEDQGGRVLLSCHNRLGFLNAIEVGVLGPHDDLH